MDIKIEIMCPCGNKSMARLFADQKKYLCGNCGAELFKAHITTGYVYVLSNPSMPDLLKIGYTERTVESRVEELNSTGVPVPFEIEAIFGSANAYEDEQKIHACLSQYRLAGNREFFTADLKHVIQCIIDSINIEPSFLKKSGLLMNEDEKELLRQKERETSRLKEKNREMEELSSKRDRCINSVPQKTWGEWMDLLDLKVGLRKFETTEQKEKFQRAFINTLICDHFNTDKTWLNRLEDILYSEKRTGTAQ